MTAATPKRRLPSSKRPESMSTSWPSSFSARARSPSSSPGTNCWLVSWTRAPSLRRPAKFAKGDPGMAAKPVPLTQRAAWKALGEHYQKVRNVHLRSMFADDPKRGERFAVEGVGLYLDYSKHRITEETMR